MKKIIKYAVGISIILLSDISFAFKINTHVWIGAQVIEDVTDNNKVTIKPFGEFQVSSDIVQALKTNPKAYLYGNIGPDFFPDVIAGQMIVHPGKTETEHGVFQNGWNTDDWIAHLLKTRSAMAPDELAFSMGYAAHAAADFWAHTYVNTYSGAIFDIKDNDRLEAEIKHYLLEGFIDYYTPAVIKKNGQNVGKGADIIDAYVGTVPHKFLSDKLILDPSIRDKYKLLAPHLAIMNLTNEKLPDWIDLVDDQRDPLYKLIGDIIEDNMELVEDTLEDKRTLNAKICNTADEATMLFGSGTELAKNLDKEINNLTNATHAAIHNINSGSAKKLQNMDNSLFNFASKYEVQGFTQLSQATQKVLSLEAQVISKKHEIEQALSSLNKKIGEKSCDLLQESFVTVLGFHEWTEKNIPFAEEAAEVFLRGLDPTGGLGVEDLLDPLGLFSSGGSTKPKIYTETGNRSYFLEKIADAERRLAIPINSGYYSGWGSATAISQHRSMLHSRRAFYKGVIAGLDDTSIITIHTVNTTPRGYSTENKGTWFCNTVSGFVDDSLTLPINTAQALEKELVVKKSELVSAVEDLHEELVKVAKEVHTIPHKVNQLITSTSTDIFNIANEINNLRSRGISDTAQLESKMMNKVDEVMADICSDIEEVEAFVDRGTVEGAPFVAAYFIDKYAKAHGLSDDEASDALYTEWLYYGLKVWQLGLNEASVAYELTQQEVVDTLLDPKKNLGDAQAAIEEWLICEGPKLVGISSFSAENLCLIKASAEGLTEAMNSIANEADRFVEKYLLLGVPEDLKVTKRDIDDVRTEAVNYIKKAAIAKSEVLQLLDYMRKGNAADPTQINREFGYTNNNYLTFDAYSDPFSERVKAEMFVVNGGFNPEKFAPVHNSIVLAKLSLLSASELNRLVSMAGGHSFKYGGKLFDEQATNFNILINAIRTIDGDHQWLSKPPRHIRQDASDSRQLGNASYSMVQSNGLKGFRLYQDETARRNVFNKIFIGPAVSAIQTPEIHGLKRVVPATYPYRPCKAIPYPDGEKDQRCATIWLIPVLSVLNN